MRNHLIAVTSFSVIACLCQLRLAAQSPYFVSGFPTPDRAVGIPVELYSVDPVTNKLKPERQVASADDGCDSILVNSDRRFLVVATPHISPTHIEFVDMNSPLKSAAADLKYDDGLGHLAARLLDVPGQGSYFALLLWNGDTELLKGMKLTPLGRFGDLDWSDYRYVRASGTAGTGEPWADSVEVAVGAGGTLAPRLAGVRVKDLGIAVPADLRPSTNGVLFMNVNSDSLLVLSSSDEQYPALSDVGYQIHHVYRKSDKSWQSVTVPGSLSWGRGFGSWLAYTVVGPSHGQPSPGKGKRLTTNVRSGYTVDEMFEESHRYYPGTLLLYDATTGRSVQIQTGQGDSEVLLIDGDDVYYRVSDSLYRARIGSDAVSDATLLATGDEVTQIHWAFSSRAE